MVMSLKYSSSSFRQLFVFSPTSYQFHQTTRLISTSRHDANSQQWFMGSPRKQQRQHQQWNFHSSYNTCYLKRYLTTASELPPAKYNPWKRNLVQFKHSLLHKTSYSFPVVEYDTKGALMYWASLKDYNWTRKKLKENSSYQTSYLEDMLAYSNKDAIKLAYFPPLLCLPMGFYIAITLMYFTPRLVLPQSLWPFKQRQQFLSRLQKKRAFEYSNVLDHLDYQRINNPDHLTCSVLEDLCETISCGRIPTCAQILKFKPICLGNAGAFSGDDMVYLLLKAFCPAVMVSPYRPISWLKEELRSSVKRIITLDRKLQAENLLEGLTPQEAISATMMRGLDSAPLPHKANISWLRNWVKLTEGCYDREVWFVLHAMVLMSVNYNNVKNAEAILRASKQTSRERRTDVFCGKL